jgi:hypothetical protein
MFPQLGKWSGVVMSAEIQHKDSSQREREEIVEIDHSISTLSGRSVSSIDSSCSDLLSAIKYIFQQKVSSIDFTGVVFGSSFDCFVQGVMEHSTIKKVTLTASKLTQPQVQILDELASMRKGLVLVDSEGGFIGGVHTNWPLYYKTLYLDKAELKDTELRQTPSEGIKIYKARYKRLPKSFIDIGAADGSNTIPLMLMGCGNIDAIDIDQSQGERFALKLELKGLTKLAQKTNVRYHLLEFMDFQCDIPGGVEFFISNYVWSYRAPSNFTQCFKKSVESVAEDGVLCGEFFGKPPTPPRHGITFHTCDEAIDVLQTFNLEILYFEIEPHAVSLSTRKDAETIPWGDLYRVAARKTSTEVEASSYERVKEVLSNAESLNQPQIYNVLESVM